MSYNWDINHLNELAEKPLYTARIDKMLNPRPNQRSKKIPPKQVLAADNWHLTDHNFLRSILTDQQPIEIGSTNCIYTSYLTENEVMNSLHEFFSVLPKQLFVTFLEEYKYKDSRINFEEINNGDCNAITFAFEYDNEYYIAAENINNISGATVLAHEYGHICHFKTKPLQDWTSQYRNLLVEFSSMFLELLSIEYYKQFPEFRHDANIEAIKNFNNYIQRSQCLRNKFDIIREFQKINTSIFIEDYNYRKYRRQIAKSLDIKKSDFDAALDKPSSFYTPYVIGYMLAIELYYIYKENPEQAFDIYYQIINLNAQNEEVLFRKIKELGLNPNSSIQDYAMSLKRSL